MDHRPAGKEPQILDACEKIRVHDETRYEFYLEQHLGSLRLRAFARATIRINEFPKFRQFIGRELARFNEVGGQSTGGTIEDAVDKFADHRSRSRVLRDGRRPLVAAAGRLPLYQALVDHETKHRGDGSRCDFATLPERFADFAKRGWAALPQGAEDFEFAVGWMLAGRTSHKSSFR
jgi:hypothetical protein